MLPQASIVTPSPLPCFFRPPTHPYQQSKRAASADGSDIPAIPVTVRQLEAVIRISESLAKMNLQVADLAGWAGQPVVDCVGGPFGTGGSCLHCSAAGSKMSLLHTAPT